MFSILAVNDPYQSNLQSLLERIGDNVSTMAPEQIIMIAQAGSYLYGLATPESDVDFVVIYATPVQVFSVSILNKCLHLYWYNSLASQFRYFQYLF